MKVYYDNKEWLVNAFNEETLAWLQRDRPNQKLILVRDDEYVKVEVKHLRTRPP